jgi:hypothetical protein
MNHGISIRASQQRGINIVTEPSDNATETPEPASSILDQNENIDWALATLIGFAEAGMEVGVTLNIQGQLITGKLISGRKYFDNLSKLMEKLRATSPDDSKPSFDALKYTYTEFAEIYPTIDKAKILAVKPHFIHLENAKIFLSRESFIPERGILWRGKLASVDGFIVGNLEISS